MCEHGAVRPGHDWKRRGERLVRASGLGYTIVRPGWFDDNDADQQRLVMLQGDRRWASDPSDGVVSRAQIAQVRGPTEESKGQEGASSSSTMAWCSSARSSASSSLSSTPVSHASGRARVVCRTSSTHGLSGGK